MRKKQKFEDFSCNSNDSNFSDRKLRSKNRGSNRLTTKSDALNKAIDGRQCDIDDLTDECRSEITDALSDVSDDNSSDPDYDLRVSHKSDAKRKSFSGASIIFVQPPDYDQYEFLELPLSASDLLISLQNLWSAVGIYEVLYQFSSVLRLTTFRFENFCAALCVKENTKLLAECHMSLLKCILKEDEQNGIVLTTRDCKDSLSISFYCMDDVTWYENVCMYLESISMKGLTCYRNAHHYYSLSVEQKLILLQSLIDLFICTNAAREVLFKENELVHEEHCRSCHKRGNLLCCESCPAMYHLSCIDPPLETIPSGDWYCLACHKQKVARIEDADCSSMNSQLTFGRKEPLGFDRHGRKYWHLVRRIFVEDDNDLLAYYSTEAQLDELLSKFHSEDLEKLLQDSFSSSRDDIISDMKVTESLTNKFKDSRKSCLSHDDEQVNLRRTNQVNVIFDEGPTTQQNETVQNSQSGANNPWSTETFFKLGMECSFRKYSNVYSTEILALSRQQQFEEREKKRHLSYKFSLTPAAEFNWICGKNVGKFGVNGGHETMLEILRRTIINLQESIPRPFMHANWSLHCSKWLKAISKCTTAREFSLVLMIFEACIRPMVFNSVWHQALGHSTLHRMTAIELEEGKKREKEVRSSLKEELNWNQPEGVKYSLGVHHAIWKQRGEEYRVSGLHSWYWVSPVRASKKSRPIHQSSLQPPDGKSPSANGNSNENTNLDNQIFDVEQWLNLKTPLADTTPSTKYLNGLLKRRLQLNEQVESLINNVQEMLTEADLQEGKTSSCPPLSNDNHNVDVENDNTHDKSKPIENVVNESNEKSKQLERDTFQSLDSITKRIEAVLQTRSLADKGVTNNVEDLKGLLDTIHSTKLRVSLKKLLPSQRSKNINGGLPMAHYFEVKKQKRRTDILVLDKEKLQRLARRSGVMEVPGFNYPSSGSFCPLVAQALSKINPGSSRFVGCPRANFHTSWRFRTRMASNLSYLALQLKVLYACIRWDDMYSSYPSNGILVVDGAEHGTDDLTTYEMLDKRTITSEFDPVSYRVEYLVRKKVIPKESSQPLPPSNGERTTQRTGLRERRVIEPMISEEFIPEDEMELWQIKYFADANEKQLEDKTFQDKKLLKVSSSTPSLVKPSSRPQTPTNPVDRAPSVPSLKTNHALTKPKTSHSIPGNPLPNVSTKVSIEDELKKKRMEMRQNRFESATNSPSSVPSPQAKELPLKLLQTCDSSTNSKSGLCMNELLKHISVVKSPDGKIEVLGLKEGQEAVHLPGGKIKIIVSSTDSSTKSLPANIQPTACQTLGPDSQATKQGASLTKQISDQVVDQKSDEAEEKELIPKEMECQSIQTEVSEHTTKILAGLKNAFQKKITMSEFAFHHKDYKSSDIASESLANCASAPSKAAEFGNGATLADASPKFSDGDKGRQMKLQVTPEPSKKMTNMGTKSPQNISKISSPSSRPTPAKDPQRRPIITVGQFSPANVVSKRMNMFDSPTVDGCVVDDNIDNDLVECSSLSKNRKRKRNSSEDSHSGSKKIMKSDKPSRSDDSTKDEDAKLHCLCRTPYDNTKFYIGCNNCGGWYHGGCVGLTPEQASSQDKYICELCRQQPSNQLHCLCRTPYDETKFYIGCDECFGWFHGECVGILATEAQRLESFKCPTCKSRCSKAEEPSMKVEHSLKLLQLLNELKDLPISQAFLDDSIQKNKRGFNFIEEKLLIRNYKTIEEFVEDFEGFFSDLRYYSLKQSVDYKNANRLQSMFLSKLIKLRKRL